MDHDAGEAAYVSTTIVATWPKGSFAENLAVDTDGIVFVTLHTDRQVVRVDPATGFVRPVARFPMPVAGLVFGADGTLYVGGGNPGQTPGAIWRIGTDGVPSIVAEMPDALFLNGMSLHPDGRRLLVAESVLGRVVAVDPGTGTVETWLADDGLKPASDAATPGVNGIKLQGGYAYVSVTARDRILRAPVRADGTPGPVETYAERLRADDFAIDSDGTLYVATHPARSLMRLSPDGARATLASAEHGMTGATAVAFGRGSADRRSVYVTTTGGTMTLPDPEIEPAKLVRVDLDASATSDLS